MKKPFWSILVLLLLIGLLGGCATSESAAEKSTAGDAAGETVPGNTAAGDTVTGGTAAGDAAAGGAAAENQPAAAGSAIDLDLTQLSSIMVYSEVFSMMERPEEYMDKTIKMAGLYSCFYDETTESAYHFVIIEDALACCQQGIEFIWQGDHAYPQDYPEEGFMIEVVGALQIYEESDREYYRLAATELTVK